MTSIHRPRDPPATAPERRGSASYIPPPPSKKDVLQQKQATGVPASAPGDGRAASLDRSALQPPQLMPKPKPKPSLTSNEPEEAEGADDAVADEGANVDTVGGGRHGSGSDRLSRGGTGWAHFSDVDSDTGLISGSAAGREQPTGGAAASAATSGSAAGGRRHGRHRGSSSSEGAGGRSSDSETDSDSSNSDDSDNNNERRRRDDVDALGAVDADNSRRIDADGNDDDDSSDPLAMTREQREYYANQFLTLCPSLTGRVTGLVAKQFFEKSRLPPLELSHIWALSDRDMDGQLTLAEFSTAMHLVVLRRNNVPIPDRLPPPVAAGYQPLSDNDDASPPPPPPLQQQQQQQHPPEPSVFGGIPPTGVGVLHPTPRKPQRKQQQQQQHLHPTDQLLAPPTVPPRAGYQQAAADAASSGPPPNRERLLAAVKAQKEKNHTLVRLNNELAVELKEVTEQRIALELELERLKPLN